MRSDAIVGDQSERKIGSQYSTHNIREKARPRDREKGVLYEHSPVRLHQLLYHRRLAAIPAGGLAGIEALEVAAVLVEQQRVGVDAVRGDLQQLRNRLNHLTQPKGRRAGRRAGVRVGRAS